LASVDELRVGDIVWLNLEAPTRDEIELLGQRFHFSQLELEDCVSKRQLQKIEHHEDHLFAVLHFPIISDSNQTFGSSQVSIFLGANYLVTVHQGQLRQINEVFQSFKDNRPPGKVTPGFLLYRVLDNLVDNVFPLMEGLMKELEDIEDEVFDEHKDVVRELTLLRRNIASLRRTILPLRRIIAGLYDEVQMSTPKLAANYRDINDHIEKAYATLDEARELVEIYKDTDFTVSTERSNKILAFLTILFTLSIPATVLGTFYGMNIHLPGGIQSGPWTFLGPYTTLIVIAAVSIAPAMVMVWYFHRLGWM